MRAMNVAHWENGLPVCGLCEEFLSDCRCWCLVCKVEIQHCLCDDEARCRRCGWPASDCPCDDGPLLDYDGNDEVDDGYDSDWES